MLSCSLHHRVCLRIPIRCPLISASARSYVNMDSKKSVSAAIEVWIELIADEKRFFCRRINIDWKVCAKHPFVAAYRNCQETDYLFSFRTFALRV